MIARNPPADAGLHSLGRSRAHCLGFRTHEKVDSPTLRAACKLDGGEDYRPQPSAASFQPSTQHAGR